MQSYLRTIINLVIFMPLFSCASEYSRAYFERVNIVFGHSFRHLEKASRAQPSWEVVQREKEELIRYYTKGIIEKLNYTTFLMMLIEECRLKLKAEVKRSQELKQNREALQEIKRETLNLIYLADQAKKVNPKVRLSIRKKINTITHKRCHSV